MAAALVSDANGAQHKPPERPQSLPFFGMSALTAGLGGEFDAFKTIAGSPAVESLRQPDGEHADGHQLRGEKSNWIFPTQEFDNSGIPTAGFWNIPGGILSDGFRPTLETPRVCLSLNRCWDDF